MILLRAVDLLPTDSQKVIEQLPSLRADLLAFRDGEIDKPREPDPINWKCQIAACHEISLGVMNGMIDRSEVPAPPKHRHAGDDYQKLFSRAWMQLPPERRAALQAASLRDFSDTVEEPAARRSRRRCKSTPHRPRLDGLAKNNTSGHRGVTRAGKKWIAQIFVDGELLRLGRYDRIEDAVAAYEVALAEKLARRAGVKA